LQLLELLISDPANNAANYERIVNSIGSVEERFAKMEKILACFDPVWPQQMLWVKGLMQRLCFTILPELKDDTGDL